ncbi:MAG: class I tRNA ligase family protein, partial [Clostridia bacterium]|nr:class I tRNA ligase family protein [Clostridia bacterium]
SRQLWWGHRIPAYYCEECAHINVSKATPEKCEKCGSEKLHQDEDTLDTWFSSALWPFSTLGWPNEESEDFKRYYPTNVLVTGFDIITFWVSRMMTQGLEFTNQVPFPDTLIHGIIRDSQGRKMSKTLGNGIDPLDVIEQYGADALRFSVISGTTMGNDIKYMPEKLDSAKNFANKIWNASKFVLMNLEDYDGNEEVKPTVEDKWILTKLNRLIKEVNINMEAYNLGVVLDRIYEFIWNEFCDWYIEIVKTRLYDKNCETRATAQYILNKVLGDSLKLLHPFMPFITEKIYRCLYNDDESIMISKYPEYNEKDIYEDEEKFIEEVKEIITEIRNIRAQMNVHPTKKTKIIAVTTKYKNELEQSNEFIKKLAFADEIIIRNENNNIPENATNVVSNNIEIFIPFEDLINIEDEITRLEKEKEKLSKGKQGTDAKLNNKNFLAKAPENVVKQIKEKQKEYDEKINNIEQRIKELQKLLYK